MKKLFLNTFYSYGDQLGITALLVFERLCHKSLKEKEIHAKFRAVFIPSHVLT